jgi:microcystin-dependent protein
MSQNYGSIKSMKTAKIGTVMIWSGDGNEGDLLSNVPLGWILCDGRVYQANRYPLLTSVIGNSYGGTAISGDFPHYSGTIKVPDITGRCMMDLEPAMLADVRYQQGQTDAFSKLASLVVDDGLTVSIPTLISADTDLAFNVASNLLFVGKMTGGANSPNITISPPSFSTTIYTVPRKLGINHMPYHKHPGTYESVQAFQAPPDTFSPSTMTVGGTRTLPNGCGTGSWNEATFNSVENAETWCSGAAPITFYDENTLIQTNQFNTFTSSPAYDYSKIPSTSAGARVLESQIYTDAFSSVPVTTHAEDAWTGMFPRPIETSNRRNYFGINTGVTGATGLADDPETIPAFTVNSVTITAGTSQITLPAGTNIGTEFNNIVPFMYVQSASTTGTFVEKGTQVLNITRTGNTVSDYVYVLDISKPIGGGGSTSTQLSFRHGTFPTTLNSVAAAQDPASTTFQAHNHASFDLTMTVGNLNGPTTHPVTNVSRGDVVPDTITGALNILANIANPSLNVVYLIRAY